MKLFNKLKINRNPNEIEQHLIKFLITQGNLQCDDEECSQGACIDIMYCEDHGYTSDDPTCTVWNRPDDFDGEWDECTWQEDCVARIEIINGKPSTVIDHWTMAKPYSYWIKCVCHNSSSEEIDPFKNMEIPDSPIDYPFIIQLKSKINHEVDSNNTRSLIDIFRSIKERPFYYFN